MKERSQTKNIYLIKMEHESKVHFHKNEGDGEPGTCGIQSLKKASASVSVRERAQRGVIVI